MCSVACMCARTHTHICVPQTCVQWHSNIHRHTYKTEKRTTHGYKCIDPISQAHTTITGQILGSPTMK